MGEILTTGGRGYLIPIALFALVLYAARGMFSLHGRRSQQRKEFLELWNESRIQDDLWLEVSIRHLFGTFLPAPIIRLALQQPDRGQALLEISELWPMFQLNRESSTVRWLRRRHLTLKRRKLARRLFLIAYFVCALAAVGAAQIAFKAGPASFSGWLYGVGAVVSGLAAFACLSREDSMKTAARVGEEWLVRINSANGPQHLNESGILGDVKY
jgi:hypothetical protein